MTGLKELLEADGIRLKKVSTREYHSPCPVCGGKDRFVTWPDKGESGRGWCRQCNLNVDGIAYLMQVHGITFPEAAEYVGKNHTARKDRIRKPNRTASIVKPESEEALVPSSQWMDAAGLFMEWAADNLHKNSKRLDKLQRERGISPATVKRWRLGWNPTSLKRPGENWGLDGKIYLPAGLVTPNMRDGKTVSLKIRQESGEPKYLLVRGSKVFPYLLHGNVHGTIVLVESEFDALLLWETSRDVITPIAVGGCSNKPDMETAELIAGAEILLNCMDNDTAGEQAGAWWKDWFPHCIRWKPTRKDPGEMFQTGESVRRWIIKGIRSSIMDKGKWPGKLDFYESIDELADPFPSKFLKEMTEEQIERMAIMMESGETMEQIMRYLGIMEMNTKHEQSLNQRNNPLEKRNTTVKSEVYTLR